ncbi:hypothetical protein PsAD2_03769 [Pseudovibrio axinellae]|uniref:CN hydrolase domain-containing protein n=1 Tax=Pseudovibrio axinellae TaxID=989403 RepID=A0A165V8D8_9HYPH|nr:nitrilase-related carbon-nitrogen hydrolase [Pseudovibrio axinellae]KZL13480.1 hypothetical protein PsAD2_03769 [Pseudovibrio axinellae]SER88324.1 Carbon-nitrogen hydrolase [Pseudovibrio axinellae]
MDGTISIAIAQSLVTADVAANGRHIRDCMEQASRNGVRLAHFPEGALTGYVKAQIKSWGQVDWHQVEEELLLIKEAAKRLGIWAVVDQSWLGKIGQVV